MIINNIKTMWLKPTCIIAASIFCISFSQAQKGNTDEDEKNIDFTYTIPGTSMMIKKEWSTSAISSASGEEISMPTSSLNNMLFGKLPGLTVQGTTGEPGYDAATLNIRGIGTYNSADIPIFVDGFQTNMSFFQYLSPGEIESVSILKDAAALAPFGMRGANGVIWVTTKRGNVGKPTIQFQTRFGLQQPISINKPLGTAQYSKLYNEAVSNDNGNIWSPIYSEQDILNAPNVDWFDETLRDYTPYTDVDLSLKGGNNIARYFVFMGYMNQNGLYDVPTNDTLANSGIRRFNVRTNLDINLFDIFEAKIDLGGRIEDRHYPNRASGDIWNDMARYPSNIYPVKNIDGTWTGTPVYPNNPVAETNSTGRVSTHDRTLQANFSLKEKLDFLVKGLYLKESVSFSNWTRDGASNWRTYARYIDGVQQTTDQNTPYSRTEDNGTNQWSWQHLSGTIGYDNTFGKHRISSSVNILHNTYKTDLSNNGDAGMMLNYKYMNIGGGINYVYDERYVGEFGFSFSGSDNYKPGNKWGFYPSLSMAWIISNEAFLKKNMIIDFLKLRFSVGKTGWDPMGTKRYLYQTYYQSGGGLYVGNDAPTWKNGLGLLYEPNSAIFAEQSMKYNIGLNMKLIQKIDWIFDAFLEKRSGIVSQDLMMPSTYGVEPLYRNVGKVTNKGFETEIIFSDKIGSFDYYLTGSVTYNTNKIDYMSEVITSAAAARTGHRIGALFGYEAERFYDISDFDINGDLNENLPIPTLGNVQPGDIKYKDQNGDFIIDENDKIQIGNPTFPECSYSFGLGGNVRGFDFKILFQGTAGRDINLLDAPLQNIAFRDNGNVYRIAEGRWAYYPDQGIDTRLVATYPRLSTEDNNNNYVNSTLWKRNGDYLKLRNVEIGYSLPEKWLSKIGINHTRVFLQGVNLLTISKLMKDYDMDPEVLSGYPAMKSYNIGVTVNF